jgi:hypothetical protein
MVKSYCLMLKERLRFKEKSWQVHFDSPDILIILHESYLTYSTKLCLKSYGTALVKPPIGMVMVFANV